MSLIEQFGGYEQANNKLLKMDKILKEVYYSPSDAQKANELRQAILEYRRQHNIFEVGDKVVSKENNEFVYTVITVDGGLGRLKNILFDHVYPLHNFRHATDAEIKAGKRLEVTQWEHLSTQSRLNRMCHHKYF